MPEHEILHFHQFCGIGAAAVGFNQGRAAANGLTGRFRCIGGIDNSAAAIRDFNRAVGVRGTVLDMFDREQYSAFHGAPPPPHWREATPADIQRAANNERPHIVFLSAPCKGFSGLLSQTRSLTEKYQALNRLTLRGIWLTLEAWADDPPELMIFENVPRIATRGRALLDQIGSLLRHYGYAVAETFHDCGEIGGLAQSRKRFLLVARHAAKVPPFLYEPPKLPLRAVGEIIGKLPMPGDLRGGPMHSIPNLQWKTWVRLAFVEAGSDWRSLNKLNVVDGKLADYLLVPEYRGGYMGVNRWDEPTGTVAGRSTPSNGAFSVADPRMDQKRGGAFGVHGWQDSMGAVAGESLPPNGAFAVADPRIVGIRHNNVFRIARWEQPSPAVTAGGHPTSGGIGVADPRFPNSQGEHASKYSVQPWDEPSKTITGSDRIGSGALCIADPRLPEPNDKLVALIRALDGTWHRPFTTLELAALQSLVNPDDLFDLDGKSDSAKRERIGNAVPPRAAQAIADVMGQTLLLAWSGQTFALSATPIWVQPVAVALSVKTPESS